MTSDFLNLIRHSKYVNLNIEHLQKSLIQKYEKIIHLPQTALSPSPHTHTRASLHAALTEDPPLSEPREEIVGI